MTPDDFRKQVKDVLEHLYDTAYLEVQPLLNQVTNSDIPNRLSRAQKLRSLLKETVERLRPQSNPPASSPAWRSYLALHYHYVQGMSMAETGNELGISLRQLQRELHKGMDALSALLWELRSEPLPSSEQGEVGELQNELRQWELTREPCDMLTLVHDTLAMLSSAHSSQLALLNVGLMAGLPPVFVDSTLTCQALLHVIRWALHSTGGKPIHLSSRLQDNNVCLVLEWKGKWSEQSDEDWQISQLLILQQGGVLALETNMADTMQAVLRLPRAIPTRVLVVDDNQAIHQLFERYLAPHHYVVLHARSGTEALTLASEAQPHIITLDVMMPSVDGWHVLRDLAAQPATSHIPVVVCSVLKESELAFSLGARAYLKKPVERLELLTTLARFQLPAIREEGVSPPARTDN